MGEFNTIIGPMLIGTVLNVFLLGIMVQQCHIYFISYPKDRVWIKIMVAFVLFVDVAGSAFATVFAYVYTIAKFEQVVNINKNEWIMFSTSSVGPVILPSTVQLFYAWRLKKLTGKTWLSLVINFFVCMQLLGGITSTIVCAVLRDFARSQKYEVIVTVSLIMASLIDVSITVTLVWYLRRRKTGFVDIDDLVTRIIRLTVQTGAATTMCSIIALVLYLACQNDIYMIFGIPLSKMYTVSLMSSLNARRWKHEDSKEELTGLSRTQETSGTSTVVIICRHAPNFDPGPTRPIVVKSMDQDGFSPDLADASDVKWHKV